MKFKPFSSKQKIVLTWWASPKLSNYDAIICDGAVRSGKTLCTSLSFVNWATAHSNGKVYAICGKTVTSLRRNLVNPLVKILRETGYKCIEKHTGNYIDVCFKGRSNRFFLFGGKDSSSASLIQGITLSGILLDEVALMPRSFVEQALARCSDEGSKFWFNCNPEHPYHWFYLEWIKKAKEKNALYLHFTMDDNPSLSEKIKERYRSLYSGVFYERFVLGKWVASSGAVYPMFDYSRHVVNLPPDFETYYISCDYGTVNPTSCGLWGRKDKVWYRIDEYYYNSRQSGKLRTDEEHYSELLRLANDLKIEAIVADPSAASFMECIRRHGKFKVIPANNDVISGIRKVSEALRENKILFSKKCKDSLREFSLYSWEENTKTDKPKKENDHAMDDIRYFVSTVISSESDDDFFVLSAKRF